MACHGWGGHLTRPITLARVSVPDVRVSGGRLKENIRLIQWLQVHGVSFKKRAPKAIKEIRAFAEKAMVRGHARLFAAVTWCILC
jgi:hypothetical protein